MANWYGFARSNYFRVKDTEAFHAWAAKNNLAAFQRGDRHSVSSKTYDGGWPTSFLDENAADDVRDFDIVDELAVHVAEGEIVVCIEAGAEKLRYITGAAIAFKVTAGGVETLYLSLGDIYKLAELKWGVRPNAAEY